MLQIWIHSILFHKNIYPSEAFHKKNVYGVDVFIAKSLPLKKYLDSFFFDLKPHLIHLNCL
jgi:hypothetical protein